jgi:hypothetical protein
MKYNLTTKKCPEICRNIVTIEARMRAIGEYWLLPFGPERKRNHV